MQKIRILDNYAEITHNYLKEFLHALKERNMTNNRKEKGFMELGEGIKKLLLAGIGTAAITAEKSKDILDELVKKGALTVEQGKALNQELKKTVKETVKKNVNISVKPSSPEELSELLAKMTPEQLAALKEQIQKMEVSEEAEESEAEEEKDVAGSEPEASEEPEEGEAEEEKDVAGSEPEASEEAAEGEPEVSEEPEEA